MNYLFSGCYSLISLPDISSWSTNNVYDMTYMFGNCSTLKSLRDISKWNFSKTSDMSFMFYNCSSSKSFPINVDWKNKINKRTKTLNMFEGCYSLQTKPNITLYINDDNFDYDLFDGY